MINDLISYLCNVPSIMTLHLIDNEMLKELEFEDFVELFAKLNADV